MFFFNFKNFNCIICVYIYVHEDLNLTQNREPCLSMSVVCRVCAGFDLETVLSESLHSVSLCSLHSFFSSSWELVWTLWEIGLYGEQLKKDWFLCSIKEGVLGHLQCSARYFSFCVIWPYESCHFFGYVLLIAYVFFFFFGRICCKFSYFCICLFVLNSGSCLELGFVVIF